MKMALFELAYNTLFGLPFAFFTGCLPFSTATVSQHYEKDAHSKV